MIVYCVWSGESEYFASKAAAFKAARKCLLETDPSEGSIEVTRHSVVPLTKAAFLRILNWDGGGWSDSSEVVKVFRKVQQ